MKYADKHKLSPGSFSTLILLLMRYVLIIVNNRIVAYH